MKFAHVVCAKLHSIGKYIALRRRIILQVI